MVLKLSVFHDPTGYLPNNPNFNRDKNKFEDLPLEFYHSAWDADAFYGYVDGYLRIPILMIITKIS